MSVTDFSLDEALRDPAVHADPYSLYAEVRSWGPWVQTPYGKVVSHHAEVTAALRDPRLSSSSRHQAGYPQFVELANQMGLSDLLAVQDRMMLFADPPDHTRLRRLVSKGFHLRAVEDMRPWVEQLVDDILDSVAPDGGMDVTATLAYPLPVTVICQMLGVPVEDRPLFEDWTRAAVRAIDPGDDFTVFFAARDAFVSYGEYFEGLIAERRRHPGDDLLSALLTAEDEGDRLTRDELLATMVLLFVAGHETTVNLIGNGLLALLRHPGELERLRDDPSLDADAVEELLRFDAPVQLTARNATTDLEVAGIEVPKGEQLVLLLAAANRDEAAFASPDVLDIGRTDNRHVAFGGGIHLCLGAPLARVEAQAAIGRLVRRFPSLALAGGDPAIKETVTLRGPEALPVTW
jgi:pimeloyl-[acyl-carrier protein] synthase